MQWDVVWSDGSTDNSVTASSKAFDLCLTEAIENWLHLRQVIDNAEAAQQYLDSLPERYRKALDIAAQFIRDRISPAR
jgi:hypothetical protein